MDKDIDEIIKIAQNETESDNPLVQIAWLIQGLDLKNYTLEQTQRYVISNIKNLTKKAEVDARIDELEHIGFKRYAEYSPPPELFARNGNTIDNRIGKLKKQLAELERSIDADSK